MYKTLHMKSTRIFRQEWFRTPMAQEKALGLWVDRIGQRTGDVSRPKAFRMLSLYAAIAVERGTGVFRTPARGDHEVAAGDAMLLFPDEAALYHAHDAWETRWIVWNGPEAATLEKMGNLKPSHPVIRGGAAAVVTAWRRISPAMAQQDFESLLARKIALLDLIRDLSTLTGSPGPDTAPPWLPAAMRILAGEGNTPESLHSLARRLHVSPAHFRRRFADHTGTSPKAFQQAQRINRAKELLAAGRSLKDVAATLGFSDVFHFMRQFRRVTGQTAGQFARKFPMATPRH